MRLPKEPDHDLFEHHRIAFQVPSKASKTLPFLCLNRRRVPVKSQKLFEMLKVTKKTLVYESSFKNAPF